MALRTLKFCTIAFVVLLLPSKSLVLAIESVVIRGEGASFPDPVYKAWIPSFTASRSKHVQVSISYLANGSGRGKAAIKQKNTVEYAGSDSVLSPEEYAEYPDLKMFPTMAGALVLAYNLPELGKQTLRLTRDLIVGIYNGTYTNWNDSRIREENQGVDFPNETILVIARADRSGSTAMFTEALSKFSTDWAKRPRGGVFSDGVNNTSGEPIHWDRDVVHLYGMKTRGMSGLIMSIKYTIGYLSVADANQTGSLKYADLQNKAGKYVRAGSEAVQSAMEYYSENELTTSIADSPLVDSYPIAGYTYFIVYMTSLTDCSKAVELIWYILWFMNDAVARRQCVSKNMVPLSNAVVQKVTNGVIKKMSCGPNSANVWELREIQRNEEYWNEQTWRVPVAVSTSLVLLMFLCVLIYFIYQRHKLRKMIDNDEWDIPIEDIIFYFDEKNMSSGKSKLVGFRSVKSFKSLDDIPEGLELLTNILQWPGKWNANHVGLRLLEVKTLNTVSRDLKKSMLWMRDSVIHTNVLRFFGLTELDMDRYVISEYCGKGPMTDILQDEKYNFTSDFKFSLSNDIASGLYYLHAHNIVHGNLKSSCCLIDNRWNVKIADWEYCKLLLILEPKKNPLSILRANNSSQHVAAFSEFWTAPEIVRSDYELLPTISSDVYSFSIILQEIFTREDPYAEHADLLPPEDVLNAILNNGLRPKYTTDTAVGVRQIMEIGWADEPSQRPNMDQVLKMLRHANPTRKSILDNMMEAMEEYTAHLEERIEERTSELVLAKQDMETLLSGLIPPHVAAKIANGQTVKCQTYDCMSILSIVIQDFPDFSMMSEPQTAVSYLNEVNGELENVLKKYDIFRSTMDGDIYTLISGFCSTDHGVDYSAVQIGHLALDIVDTVAKLPQPSFHSRPVRLRYGAHYGRIIGAMVGAASPRFCVLGSAMKTAITLRESSIAGKIHISESFHSVINTKGFHTEERNISNTSDPSGDQKTYWLVGRDCLHTDLSSDKSSDSGIDGMSLEKSTTTPPQLKQGHTEITVSKDEGIQKRSLRVEQEEKWRQVFSKPPIRRGISVNVENDIELMDLSNSNDDTEQRQCDLKQGEYKDNLNNLDKKDDDLILEIRMESPVSSQASDLIYHEETKRGKAKTNKVFPIVLV